MDAHDARAVGPSDLLEHGEFVRRLARRLVGDPHEAEDVAQEAMLAALRRPQPPRSPRGWLGGTVANLARMTARGAARRRSREGAQAPARAAADPLDVAARLEVQRRVVEAVTALGEPYRSTVVLRYFHDLGTPEIARLAGVPLETVRTRLTRAHDLLRRRLDAVHGTRAAWVLPLAPATGAGHPGTSLSHWIGALTMKAKLHVAWILLPLLGAAGGAGAVFLLRGGGETSPEASAEVARLQGENARLAAENRRLVEEARRLLAASAPKLPGAERSGSEASTRTPAGAETEQAGGSPAPGGAASPTPGTAAPDGPAGLAAIDWERWIPVLARYAELDMREDPPEELLGELMAFLGEIAPNLERGRWKGGGTAEDLLRLPEVTARIAVAAAGHKGAALDEEARAALVGELQQRLEAEAAGREGDRLKAERLADVLEAVASIYEVFSGRLGPERASQVVALLVDLLPDRTWGTMHLGSATYLEFESLVLQMWDMRARMDAREREAASRVARTWWEAASGAIDDAVRMHGRDAVRAAVTRREDDDAATARARAEPTFAGLEVQVHAALAREQARAHRAFHGLWLDIPEERRRAFDPAEPSLLLFFPAR